MTCRKDGRLGVRDAVYVAAVVKRRRLNGGEVGSMVMAKASNVGAIAWWKRLRGSHRRYGRLGPTAGWLTGETACRRRDRYGRLGLFAHLYCCISECCDEGNRQVNKRVAM